MTDTSMVQDYQRAGFGRRVVPGSKPAVVVVDFSNGFTQPVHPTGTDASAAILATCRLLESARAGGFPVIFTTIAYSPAEAAALPWLRKATGMAALLHGSRLVEIDARLERREHEPLIVKHGASAFHGTNLAALLVARQVDTVLVTGATTSGCVRASVVDAVQYGFNVLVPKECVADRASAPHEANLFDIQQKYADVISTDDALTYLQKTV